MLENLRRVNLNEDDPLWSIAMKNAVAFFEHRGIKPNDIELKLRTEHEYVWLKRRDNDYF